MLTELQQKRVWENWLSAEIRAAYFGELVHLYQARQRHATWLTLLLTSGAAAVAFATLPVEWRVPLPVLAAAISLYSTTAGNTVRSADCADLHFRWTRLAQSYQRLWETGMYASGAIGRLNALDDKVAEVSRSSTQFPDDARRLAKWEDWVVSHRAPHAPRHQAA